MATPLVYLWARRFVAHRPARATAWIHAVLPTALFFGASLWAEPLYVLLLLGTLVAATGSPPRLLVAGAALGLLLLTRTAALPLLAVVPLLAARGSVRPRRAALLTLAVALAVVAPWQAALQREEGRFAALSTSAGWNLALGNAAGVGPGEGSLWVGPDAHAELREDLEAGGGAGTYVRERLRRDPVGGGRRALDRLRLTWAADLFPTRHAAHAIHRPLPAVVAGGFWLLQAVLWWTLAILAVRGLLHPGVLHRRALLLAPVLAGCLGPLLTVGFRPFASPVAGAAAAGGGGRLGAARSRAAPGAPGRRRRRGRRRRLAHNQLPAGGHRDPAAALGRRPALGRAGGGGGRRRTDLR